MGMDGTKGVHLCRRQGCAGYEYAALRTQLLARMVTVCRRTGLVTIICILPPDVSDVLLSQKSL